MRPILLATLFAALFGSTLARPAAAQCPIAGAIFTSYGFGCTQTFTAPTLSASFDAAACTMSFTLTHFPGCCNTFTAARYWVFGLSPAANPLPFLGPNCFGWNSAEMIVETPSSAGPTLTATIPPFFFPGFTFFAQGAVRWFTTIGFTNEFGLSEGLQVSCL